jgi:WD40 repeat protein
MNKQQVLRTLGLTGSMLTAVLLAGEALSGDAAPTPGAEPLPGGALVRFGSFRGREPARRHHRGTCLPSHNLFATGGHDDMVHLFDLATGQSLRSLIIDDQWAGPMVFAPDGKVLVVECRADLCLFDVATGKEKARLVGHGSRIDGLAFSPDGKWLASAGGKEGVRVWDLATGKLYRHITAPERYHRSVVFAPDSRTIAVVNDTDRHDELRFWNVVSGTERRSLPTNMQVGGVAFSGDGKRFALAGDALSMWDWISGKQIWKANFAQKSNHPWRHCRVAFSPDGTQVVSATGMTIHLFDAVTGQPLRQLRARAGEDLETDSDGQNMITLLAFSDDGNNLYSWACGDRLRIWDPKTGRQKRKSEGHESTVVSVAFSADGKRVISKAEDDEVRVWEAATGKGIPLGKDDRQGKILASNGRLLVVEGELNKPCSLVEMATGKERRKVGPFPRHWLFSPDGRFLVGPIDGLVSGDRLEVVETETNKARTFLPNGRAALFSFRPASFAVARPWLVVVAASGKVQVWDLTAPVGRVQTIEADKEKVCRHAVLSPDGTLVAGIVDSDTIRIWQTSTGKEIHTFKTGLSGDLLCLAFSPDNRTLVSGGEHNGVRLWEVVSGQLRCQWKGHQSWVTAVAFSPDGRRIVSGSADWTLLSWDVAAPLGKLVLSDPAECWKDLSSEDAQTAYWTICQMVRLPETFPFIRQQFREALKTGGPQMGKLIRQLDSDSFEEREKASEELEKLGKDAEEPMRKALNENPSAEVKQRLERLLDNIKPGSPAPERLRWVRAVEVMEKIGTAEAHDLLRQAAKSEAGGWLPEAALEVVRRLDRITTKP